MLKQFGKDIVMCRFNTGTNHLWWSMNSQTVFQQHFAYRVEKNRGVDYFLQEVVLLCWCNVV